VGVNKRSGLPYLKRGNWILTFFGILFISK
jgi:hypothetical protein